MKLSPFLLASLCLAAGFASERQTGSLYTVNVAGKGGGVVTVRGAYWGTQRDSYQRFSQRTAPFEVTVRGTTLEALFQATQPGEALTVQLWRIVNKQRVLAASESATTILVLASPQRTQVEGF